MTYILEISINIKKNPNISDIINNIINIANDHKMKKIYKEFEFIGKNRQMYRNHCILTMEFEEHDEILSLFIKKIKTIKTVRIECIALEDIIYKLIYASRSYLNIMEKEFAKDYLEKQRKGLLYKQNTIIFKAIKKLK
tara:strand:- start:143 stop:556 length:414 start_codon:yes stop_codon:yes gene_type:complete